MELNHHLEEIVFNMPDIDYEIACHVLSTGVTTVADFMEAYLPAHREAYGEDYQH